MTAITPCFPLKNAMADFNFKMDTEKYKMTTKILDDSWWLMWPQGIDENGFYPEEKIDHIFLSPGSQVFDARFIDDPASDHPAVTAEIEWKVNPDN
jgi:endonuclease/exonuclease/phosphatase family metal-dependent hydrolase